MGGGRLGFMDRTGAAHAGRADSFRLASANRHGLGVFTVHLWEYRYYCRMQVTLSVYKTKACSSSLRRFLTLPRPLPGAAVRLLSQGVAAPHLPVHFFFIRQHPINSGPNASWHWPTSSRTQSWPPEQLSARERKAWGEPPGSGSQAALPFWRRSLDPAHAAPVPYTPWHPNAPPHGTPLRYSRHGCPPLAARRGPVAVLQSPQHPGPQPCIMLLDCASLSLLTAPRYSNACTTSISRIFRHQRPAANWAK